MIIMMILFYYHHLFLFFYDADNKYDISVSVFSPLIVITNSLR